MKTQRYVSENNKLRLHACDGSFRVNIQLRVFHVSCMPCNVKTRRKFCFILGSYTICFGSNVWSKGGLARNQMPNERIAPTINRHCHMVYCWSWSLIKLDSKFSHWTPARISLCQPFPISSDLTHLCGLTNSVVQLFNVLSHPWFGIRAKFPQPTAIR